MQNIIELKNRESIPLYLLLQADPSVEKINEYLWTGRIFVTENNDGEVIGTCVLVFENEEAEIKNISVEKPHQGTGIGRNLLEHAKNLCRKSGVKSLTVRTGNSSIDQLAFYQKCGFEMVGIIPDFFIKNYPEPIFENGIQCKHQIVLQYEFTNI